MAREPRISVRMTELIKRCDLAELLSFAVKAEQLKQRTDREERRKRPQCGAKTRKGTPCVAKVFWPVTWLEPAKRCRLHGGLSTGPKTPEGKLRLAEAARQTALRMWEERKQGKRPLPRQKKGPTLEEELADLSPQEIDALASAMKTVLTQG